jgi:beta-lactamase regulating signal transducer with metallopeptidase domain
VNSERILMALIEVNVGISIAVIVVLALRPVLSRLLGAVAAYRLWLLVPITAAAMLIPLPHPSPSPTTAPIASERSLPSTEATLVGEVSAATRSAAASATTWAARVRGRLRLAASNSAIPLGLWLVGGLLLLGRAILRSRRLAADPSLGPALIGVFRPRLVLPTDFTIRFDRHEQQLILAHELAHKEAGHTVVNALIEVARCVNWVNPLMHVAAFYARADQELACDAAVMAQFPRERRTYALALLKAQTRFAVPPLGCAWPGRSSRHLRRRIEMLGRRLPGRGRSAAALLVVGVLALTGGYVAWAQQPTDTRAVGAPADAAVNRAQPLAAVHAEPPAGLLTELEKKRHVLFMKWAQAGNTDVVFIGDSTVDFWHYPRGGKAEWDRTYAPLKAVNFGVEGAHTRSVLWRLQNGELAGITPKVIVLCPLGIADSANHNIEVPQIIEGDKAIIAELRQREPQTKILLVAFPRGQPTHPARQLMATVDAALAKLADDRSIYYLDLKGAFLSADGTLVPDLYTDPIGQVLSPKGYAAWAQAMNPTLMRLLH